MSANTEMNNIINTSVINISILDEILYNDNNYKNGILYIDIDNTCMIKECVMFKIFELNPMVRARIIKNTKKLSFTQSDKLIKTRHELNDFIVKCKKSFNKVYFFTKHTKDNLNEIKIQSAQLVPDIEVVNINQIQKADDIDLYMIDINSDSFNKIIKKNKYQKNTLFQMFIV
jgi:hypothetical protein